MGNKTYPIEFKREAASLVLDQDYTLIAACKAMGVGQTAMRRWVKQLQEERGGITPDTSKAFTEAHQEIQALREENRRLRREKEILKKASALLMSEAFNGSP